MKLIISKDSDINYLAKIVNIKEFTKHPDPTIQRLKCCQVDGFNIITDIDSIPGLYVYFPVMSQINQQFLSYASSYQIYFRHHGTILTDIKYRALRY